MLSHQLRRRISALSRTALRRREDAMAVDVRVKVPPSITRVMAGPADVRLHRAIEEVAVGEVHQTPAGDS